MRTIIVLFLFVCTVFSAQGFQQDSALYKKNPNYNLETDFYKIYKKKQADIVFLGNSITKGVSWPELLGRDNVAGRGIPSDVLEGMLARTETVLSLRPKIIFIMAGINDIYNWLPVETISEQYTRLISEFREKGIRVVVQSTLYVSPRWPNAADRNREVEKLNTLMQSWCKQNGVDFLDLNPGLSISKFLREELTYDGIHLKAEGYRLWGREIEKLLIKYGI
ncbi:MAG: GDSL-type esterase/lipase family protein [Ignavibacteriaceae bacterium]|nr:GDSL-type esterase/lipase family protein [Ignavibacteriaceae bacterium]